MGQWKRRRSGRRGHSRGRRALSRTEWIIVGGVAASLTLGLAAAAALRPAPSTFVPPAQPAAATNAELLLPDLATAPAAPAAGQLATAADLAPAPTSASAAQPLAPPTATPPDVGPNNDSSGQDGAGADPPSPPLISPAAATAAAQPAPATP